MIIYILYLLSYISETLIVSYYFNAKFKSKINAITQITVYSMFALISYLIGILGIPFIDIPIFVIFNFIVLTFCYDSNIKSRLVNILILTSAMMISDAVITQLQTIFYDKILIGLSDNIFYSIILSVPSKLLFSLITYICSKFSINEHRINISRFSIPLSVLPISSTLWMIFSYHTFTMNDILSSDSTYKITFYLCNMMILFSNIIVFYFHEQTVKANQKYTELMLIQQKEKNSNDFYNILKQQNENSRILIHDIKKHLSSIEMLKSEDYINTIIDDFEIEQSVSYCNNTLLNLITYRYTDFCRKNKISFDVNIQNTQLDFMAEPDITSLFDNLLENSVEAAIQSTDKTINFSIDMRNMNFLVINISNTCKNKPAFVNNHLFTTKNDKSLHGIGMKSIKRVVKKYEGNIDMNYDDNTSIFTTVITFQIYR